MKSLLLSAILISVVAMAEEKVSDQPSEVVSTAPGRQVGAEALAPADYVLCRNGAVVRTIRVEKKKNSCQTTYTKEGTESVVGKSWALKVCRHVLDQIRGNLEKANWKCKDITQSRVSSSVEQ